MTHTSLALSTLLANLESSASVKEILRLYEELLGDDQLSLPGMQPLLEARTKEMVDRHSRLKLEWRRTCELLESLTTRYIEATNHAFTLVAVLNSVDAGSRANALAREFGDECRALVAELTGLLRGMIEEEIRILGLNTNWYAEIQAITRDLMERALIDTIQVERHRKVIEDQLATYQPGISGRELHARTASLIEKAIRLREPLDTLVGVFEKQGASGEQLSKERTKEALELRKMVEDAARDFNQLINAMHICSEKEGDLVETIAILQILLQKMKTGG